MSQYIYELEMKVRDYECDLQGIVNNANYQHYLEHTRHEFLTSVGVSFAALHEQGVDPVVARINMAFKTPLKSGDEFVSKLYMKKEGIKYVFYQEIQRHSTVMDHHNAGYSRHVQFGNFLSPLCNTQAYL